jgi:hypothetical protein
VGVDIRRGGWQPAPVSPLAILASQGRVGSQRALKAANALEGAHRNIRVRYSVEWL